MANVSFHLGTKTPSAGSLEEGGLYIDKTNGQIFIGTSLVGKKQIGSSMKMLADKGWNVVSGTTGVPLDEVSQDLMDTIVSYAQDIIIHIKAPEDVIFPNCSQDGKTIVSYYHLRLSKDWNPESTYQFSTYNSPDSFWYNYRADSYAMLLSLSLNITASGGQDAHSYQYVDSTGLHLNSRTNNLSPYITIVAYKF